MYAAGFLASELDCSFFPVLKFGPAKPTLSSQRVADPPGSVVPLTLFRGGIVDQRAVHDGLRPVATVVPDPVVTNAGYHEEARGDPLVEDVGRWTLLREKGGGARFRVWDGLHRQIGAGIVGEKASPCSAFRRTRVPGEDRDRRLERWLRCSGSRIAAIRVARESERGNEGQSQGEGQAVHAHEMISGFI